jgi:predicted dienelactone hydrolase
MHLRRSLLAGPCLALAPVVLAVLAVLAAAQAVAAQPAAAAKYADDGPATVVHNELEVPFGNKTLQVAIWYPAHSKVAVPLIVYSPGLGGTRGASAFLLNHLASYGFATLSWDPRGEDESGYWQGAVTRQQDNKTLIAWAERMSNTGKLGVKIDFKRIGTAGHSSGGWSALTGAGARLDFRWCLAHPLEAASPGSDCAEFVPHAKDIAQRFGLKKVPTGLWPATNDKRVAAVLALAPDGDIWGDQYQGVQVLTVPVMVMCGTQDKANSPEQSCYPVFEHLGSQRKSLVKLKGSDHGIFTDDCDPADAACEKGAGHRIINSYATAFFLANLKRDPGAVALLGRDANAATFQIASQGYNQGYNQGVSSESQNGTETRDNSSAAPIVESPSSESSRN